MIMLKTSLLLIILLLVSGLQFLQMVVVMVQHTRNLGRTEPSAGSKSDSSTSSSLSSSLRNYIWTNALTPPSPSSSCEDDVTAVTPSLHDPTVKMSPCIHRPWLLPAAADKEVSVAGLRSSSGAKTRENSSSNSNKSKPQVKVLLTSYGWNHPDVQRGLATPRSKRQRELLQAIVDHPLFDPRGWDDYTSGRKVADPDIRYYVFLDVETCHEANYPHYGKPDLNQDVDGGRAKEPTRWDKKECYNIDQCPYVNQVLTSPVFTQDSVQSTLVYFECKGTGPWEEFRKEQPSKQISIVSLSAHESQILPSVDQGLPPPAVSENLSLTRQEVERIESCDAEADRPHLLTFVGALRKKSPRQRLVNLHNETLGVVAMSKVDFLQQQEQQATHHSYSGLLKQSKFAAAPRGTNLFSYRFTEVLAAGAIPVIHSDGWVLPFRRELVDWSQCAVIIPEDQMEDTVRILQDISPDQRCRMRQRCLEIYQAYIATPQGTVKGILQGLELVVAGAAAAASSVAAN